MKKVLLNQRYRDYKPGRILPLEDEEAEQVVANSIGEYVGSDEPGAETEETEPLMLEGFTKLGAAAQKDLLLRLEIEGDDSNPEKRIALYAEFLNKGAGGGGEE